MLRSVLALAAIASLAGCASESLRRRTVDQGATLPELQYQQVLDNLALFSANPSALPCHVNIPEGTTQITDSASIAAALDPGPASNWLPQLFGSRTVVAQWGGAPVIDTLELRLLRITYRRAHGSLEMPGPDLLDELAHELKNQVAINTDLRDESELFYEYQSRKHDDYAHVDADVVTANDESFTARDGQKSPLARDVSRQVARIERELVAIGTGWFCVGGRVDVPRDACDVVTYPTCWASLPT